MSKRGFKVIMVAITIVTIFQLFFRYKIAEVDTYVIKDDRLTLTIYTKHRESLEWKETRFKSLSQARHYFEEGILLEKNLGQKFLWWDTE
jgi:hypothetical protein